MTDRHMILATVSGSFHRHMVPIAQAVATLTDLGVHVMSPADPRVVEAHGDFLFVASDRTRSVRLVQDRHLESVRASDFLWLVAPDGYVGQSASMELGFAIAHGIPVFGTALPGDLTLRQYVTKVLGFRAALDAVVASRHRKPRPGFLIDPRASIEEAHDTLGQIETLLARSPSTINDDSASELYLKTDSLSALLARERRR